MVTSSPPPPPPAPASPPPPPQITPSPPTPTPIPAHRRCNISTNINCLRQTRRLQSWKCQLVSDWLISAFIASLATTGGGGGGRELSPPPRLSLPPPLKKKGGVGEGGGGVERKQDYYPGNISRNTLKAWPCAAQTLRALYETICSRWI